MNNIWIILAHAALLVLVFFAIRSLSRTNTKPAKPVMKILESITELIWIAVLPGIGIFTTNAQCDVHPFELESLPTASTLWVVFAVAYILVRFGTKQLPPLLLAVCAALMVIGIIFCITICIHFTTAVIAVVLPGISLTYLSPFFCFGFLVKETIRLSSFFKQQLPKEGTVVKSINTLSAWLYKNHLGFSVLLSAPLLLLIQACLYLFGQRPDSIISQFTDSCGFLLSQYQSCDCGGDHYLCSVAANGNKKLVRPTRFGLRQNQKIVVNRQLLVANAFENWLEEYMPRFHRFVRRTYDSMNIPVNAWSKRKKLANVIYVFMKPLEWLFLLWLYSFDRKPETRIAKQYLPKQELDAFIKTNTHN